MSAMTPSRARGRRALAGAAALLVALLVSTAPAGATIVERVVAVVGERAILLSDLRARARPFLLRIQHQVPAGGQRAAAVSQLYSQLLDKMVDEELEQRAAGRARIQISAQEIDEALERVAAQNDVTVEVLMDEAKRSGLTERQYRTEIRRQLLEAKLLNLRVQGRIRVSEDDLKASYRRLLMEERRELGFRAAWIVLRAKSSAPDEIKERRRLAERLADEARTGADFAELALRYSDDAATRSAGGLLLPMQPGRLPEVLDAAALGLEVGGVSSPLRIGNDYYILKLVERDESQLPPFEQARNELSNRVYMEKMDKAKRHWLDSLRRRTHVDIRL